MRLIHHHILCNYYLTYRCNAKCSFCDIWEKPSPYVNLEDVEKNLKDLKKLGVSVIDFTGGEPLLHRSLPEILTLAKQYRFITTVTTNTLLYPKNAQKLAGLIDMLHFSLDSPIEEEHNESRKVKCFDKFVESINIAKDLGEKPDILFTVFPHNIHQIQEVYETFCLPHQFMLIINPVFEYHSVGQQLDKHHIQTLKKWAKKKYVYCNEAFLTLREEGGNQTNQPICKAGETTIVISPENHIVLPCYHLGLKEIPINGRLFELYQTPEVLELIQWQGKHPQCQGCVINCYMNPSFAVETNKYFFKALPSTLKYSYQKKMFGKYIVNRWKTERKKYNINSI
jgi:MoaA/NifB/PqqE/SkfB family radical SAM enzyme